MKTFTSRGIAWLLAVLAICQLGCIQKRLSIYCKYDETADRFSLLFIATHFQASQKEDYPWLARQWEWRERLIPLVGIFEDPAYLRVSNDSYQQVDLASPGSQPAAAKAKPVGNPKEPPTLKTTLPLDDITITPGAFFVGPEGTLSNHHRLDFPGKFLDEVLKQSDTVVNDAIAKGAAEELKRRSQGGKVIPWAEVQELLAKLGDKDNTAELPSLDHCFTEATLIALRDAGRAGQIGIRRDKLTFSASFPLAAEDGEQLQKTLPLLRDAGLKELREKEPAGVQIASIEKLLISVDTKLTPEGITLSLKIPAWLDTSIFRANEETDEADRKSQQATLAAIRKLSVPIRDDVKLDDLIARFREAK